MMKPFSVISYNEESGQVHLDHVEAKNMSQAFYVAAKSREDENVDVVFICTLPGHINDDGNEIGFSGDLGAFGCSITEQPDVYNVT